MMPLMTLWRMMRMWKKGNYCFIINNNIKQLNIPTKNILPIFNKTMELHGIYITNSYRITF